MNQIKLLRIFKYKGKFINLHFYQLKKYNFNHIYHIIHKLL